ncbi:hypothetical protein [Nonomuraea glycinis]|uniref:hypothetical protein n=1 Tax=Nonomuraea glycinis TaxID=2047744 RepID=UPI002E0E1EEF|nr:hypothetical protein OHA68_05160 [Nonomuraea glycinis]
MISIKMTATQWLASACRDSVRLVDGPAKLRREQSARRQDPAFYARAHFGAAALIAPVFVAGNEVPTPQFTKGGRCGPQPWRDAPVIT